MGWWIYTNYPKHARKVTKGILIWLIVCTAVGITYEYYFSNKSKQVILRGHLSSFDTDLKIENRATCFSITLKEYPEIILEYNNSDCYDSISILFKSQIQIGEFVALTVNKNELKGNKRIQFANLIYKNKETKKSQQTDETDFKKIFWIFFFVVAFGVIILYVILETTGILDKLKTKFYTEPPKPLTSPKDFNEFPEFYKNDQL